MMAEWQPIETLPKGDLLAVREGFLIWDQPDEAGFLSGCDMGPDVFEENLSPEVVRVTWYEDPVHSPVGLFIDEQGYQYVECGIESRMYDPETLDAPDGDGKRPLRLTHWQYVPDLPEPLVTP